MNYAEAYTLIGGLSAPSKMPWYGYSIPAVNCKVGSKLREIEGSVCAKCYARKGRYTFPNVQKAMERRLASITDPRWVDAFVLVLQTLRQKSKGEDRFRWHDSGDLQSKKHLYKIIEIARRCPDIRFRLPTKELAVVRGETAPPNLVISYSVPMIGQAPLKGLGTMSQSTTSKEPVEGAFNCPATFTDNHKCGACDKCWVSHHLVNYKVH